MNNVYERFTNEEYKSYIIERTYESRKKYCKNNLVFAKFYHEHQHPTLPKAPCYQEVVELLDGYKFTSLELYKATVDYVRNFTSYDLSDVYEDVENFEIECYEEIV